MALDSKNNIKSVFIVNTALSAVTSGTITPGSTNSGVAGSVVIANMSNQVLTASTVVDYDKIKIIKDRGANLPLQQVVLDLAAIKAYVGAAGQAATEQVSYIGYDGDNTNTIQVLENNFYSIKLEHTPNSFAYGKRPANYKYGTFQSPLGIAQNGIGAAIVANGLVASLIQNFRPNRTTDWRIFAAVTVAGTRLAAGASGTLTFTKYSKVVKASAAGATSLTIVGDYIQVAPGATATDGTVGTYKVAAKSGNDLILENAFNGETVSGVAATGLIRVPKATAEGTTTAFGIKITGVKQKYDVNRWRQYDKVRFNTFLDGFPNTTTPTLVTTTAAFDGTGVYEQVANDEYISWGDEGQVFVDQVPPLFREQDAVIGTQYNPVVLGWLDKLPSLIGAGENKGQAILYMSGSATVPNQGATLIDVLDAWLLQVGFPNLPSPLV
jgi:hypothetical protein